MNICIYIITTLWMIIIAPSVLTLCTGTFDRTLGNLTVSSIHNPRLLIDVSAIEHHHDEDPETKELVASRLKKQVLCHLYCIPCREDLTVLGN